MRTFKFTLLMKIADRSTPLDIGACVREKEKYSRPSAATSWHCLARSTDPATVEYIQRLLLIFLFLLLFSLSSFRYLRSNIDGIVFVNWFCPFIKINTANGMHSMRQSKITDIISFVLLWIMYSTKLDFVFKYNNIQTHCLY